MACRFGFVIAVSFLPQAGIRVETAHLAGKNDFFFTNKLLIGIKWEW